MAKTAIVTDSNSGITQKEGKELGIFVVPMPFIINGEPHFEDIDLTQEEFYASLQGGADVSTSQPSIGDLQEFWTEILKTYDEIVHIPMSSGLSQSCATATAIAKDFGDKVQVVDNQRISVTMKESVYDALKLVKEGKSAKKIKEYLEKTKLDATIYISLDTMKYLKKGGRVTPAAAAIGTILKLRPVLQIQGERLDKYSITCRTLLRAKDTMKKALQNDLETRLAPYVEKGEVVISVAHTANHAEAESFAEELKELFPNIPFRFCDPLSLSVACHIGPGALACTATRVYKK